MANLTITAASVVAVSGARTESGLAGEAITAGQIVYKASTGKFMLADADAATAIARSPRGVSLNSVALNQPMAVLTEGPVTIGATLTAGTAYYLSDDPGMICPLADVTGGDYLVQIGLATSTTVLEVDFQVTGVAT